MIPEYGVFALDPGLSSAYAWGIVRDEGSVRDRLAALQAPGSDTIKDADWMLQARLISQRWGEFRTHCYRLSLPAYFVCEDFILTRFKSSDRSGLYPIWVGAAVVGYRNALADAYELGGYGPSAVVETFWQQPSMAQTNVTDARLKDWGLWVKGREHERDAWRHFALFVGDKKAQLMRKARAATPVGARTLREA